jgi:hypothetical protein
MIQLIGIEPVIWRRVLVRSNTKLDRLHQIIQVAMGWQNCHLHQFIVRGKTYGQLDPDLDDESWPETEVSIDALLIDEGQSLVYEYDFGDGWEHRVTLEKILSSAGERVLPHCVDGQRACPPEDVGGPHGYEEFLRAYLNGQHPDHEQMVDWAGVEFEPAQFDIEGVNTILSAN